MTTTTTPNGRKLTKFEENHLDLMITIDDVTALYTKWGCNRGWKVWRSTEYLGQVQSDTRGPGYSASWRVEGTRGIPTAIDAVRRIIAETNA